MADSSIAVTPGAGSNVDTRTNATGDHRQVVVFGHPSATDSVAEVLGSDPLSNTEGVVVRDPYTTNIVSGLRDVRIQSIVDGTVTVGTIVRVTNLVDGTLSTVTRVSNVVDGTLTTITGIDRVRNLVDGTITTVTSLGTATRVDRVMNLVDGTITFIPTVQRIQNLIDGTLTTVTGVDRVRNVVDGTLSLISMAQRVNNVVDGTLSMVQRVNNVVDGTLSLVSMVQRVNNLVNGTVSIQFAGVAPVTPNSGIPAVNIYSTTSIFTVSGSTGGGTTSGVTLISPSANYNFKIFAYALQTTAVAGNVWRFTNGSGASQTEFWRGLAVDTNATSTPRGANLAVPPPGFLFATGVSTTLALVSDAGSLVHYSVSYIKESA